MEQDRETRRISSRGEQEEKEVTILGKPRPKPTEVRRVGGRPVNPNPEILSRHNKREKPSDN
jgi:hypothetical protein